MATTTTTGTPRPAPDAAASAASPWEAPAWETPADPRRWKALGVLALAVSLIVIDGTIVNVALPTMMTSLPLTFTEAQWVTTLYSLIFAALLITTGRLGDRVGRRTTLDIGLAMFTIGSLMAAVAPGPGLLIASRAIQGIGGAFVLPSTLSTVNATFRGLERTTAFGVWGATISGAAAVGPLLGGWLTASFSWRWIFGINLPLVALIVVGAHLWVAQTRGRTQATGRFDVVGLLLSTAGMGALVFGLIEGRSLGWWAPRASEWARDWPVSPAGVGLLGGSLCVVGFVLVERRRGAAGRDVLLDMGLFRLPSFAWGNAAALMVSMGEFGLLFVLPLYLQNVRGLSPIGAGWVLAAVALGAFGSAGLAGRLARVTTPATVSTIGLILEAVGVGGLAVRLRPDSPLWHVIVPLVVYGVGLGMASAQLTGMILVDVPHSQSGQGSATQSTTRQLGSALGVAVIATVMASSVASAASGSLSSSSAHLPAAAATAIEESLAPSAGSIISAVRDGAGDAAALPAPEREKIADTLAEDFTNGARAPLWVGTGFLLLGVVATTRLRNRKADDHPA